MHFSEYRILKRKFVFKLRFMMAEKRNVSDNNDGKVVKKRRVTDHFEEDANYKYYTSW